MSPSSRKRRRRQVPTWIIALKYRFYPGAVMRELSDHVEWSGIDAGVTEARVSALEEIIAARWPRSMVLRRRLGRELRASVAGYDHVPASNFHGRRLEWHCDQAIAKHRRFTERYRPAKAARKGKQ